VELAELIAAFESATLSADCFKHAEHLSVAVAFLHQARAAHGGGGPAAVEAARARMEGALRRLLERLGKPPTAYHETVTRAWMLLLDEFLDQQASGPEASAKLEGLVDAAVERFVRARTLSEHYSDERLASPRARARWLAPDRAPLPGQPWHLRLATAADAEAINAIYNHYIPLSTCTFDLEPMPLATRQAWLADHDAAHPVTVATLPGETRAGRVPAGETIAGRVPADGSVAAWGSLSRFRARPAYGHTVESSVYVDHRHHGRGLGRLMVDDLLERARALGYHTVVAGVTGDQETSLVLHRAAGFSEVARFREVGRKFDRWLDVVFLQLML
jgi:phosphinothricin acetyltransferase